MSSDTPAVYKMPRLNVSAQANNPRAQLIDMPLDTPFTLEEAATFLGCSKPSVERAIYSGKLKSARVAGGRRIKKEWLLEYLDKRDYLEKQSE